MNIITQELINKMIEQERLEMPEEPEYIGKFIGGTIFAIFLIMAITVMIFKAI